MRNDTQVIPYEIYRKFSPIIPFSTRKFLGLKGSSLTEELAPKVTEEVNVCRVFLYKTGKLGGGLHLIRHAVTPSPSRGRLVKPPIYRFKRLLLDGGAGTEGD